MSQIITLAIDAQTRNPTRKGFSTQLAMAYHTKFPDLVRAYAPDSFAAAMVADGFSVNDAAYKMVAAAFAQDPAPEKVKLGKITSAVAKTMTVKVPDATAGKVLSFDILLPNGTKSTITRTVPGSSSVGAEATAIAALVDALTGVDAAAVSDTVTITATTAGQVFWLSAWNPALLEVNETTASQGIATALGNILAIDSDFYGVSIESGSQTNITETAAWIETNKKFFVAFTPNHTEVTSSGGVGTAIKNSAYKRTAVFYSRTPEAYGACALLGAILPADPGSYTAAFKALAGVPIDELTETQVGYLEAKYVSYYVAQYGLNMTMIGKVGSGEWIDVVIFLDWVDARIREALVGVLAQRPKVAIDDGDLQLFGAAMTSVLAQGVAQKGIAQDPKFTVTVPKALDIPQADRAARRVTGLKFGFRLAGAAQSGDVKGTASV